MIKFSAKFFIFFCLIILTFHAFGADFSARITREDFADFYGILIIEEEYKDLKLDDVFSSSFDPMSGKLKRDEMFSARSPYFEPDIFRKMEKQKEKRETPEDNVEQEGYKSVYNLKLSKPAPPEPVSRVKSFKEKLLAVNDLIESGINVKNAEKKLQELEMESAGNPANLSNIAKLYIKTDNQQKALELLNKAAELSPNDFKILYTYAITLYKNEMFKQAEENLLKITQIKPGFMYAHYNLGNIYYKQEEYKKALDSFKKAMELAPDNANIYFNIALCLEQMGYKELAGRFYSKTLELNPNDNEAFKALNRLN